MQNNVCSDILRYGDMLKLHVWAKKEEENFQNTKYMENCEAMTSSTHSFAYSHRLFKKCFVENYENWKFHIFLIFYPIYIKFSLFYSKMFYSSYWINLNLIRISPLMKKLPQAFMQIGWMEDNFRNLTAKVWANLDNPIKRYDFSKISLILCMSPSQMALF